MMNRTIEECIKNLTSMSNTLSPEFEMDLIESVNYLKKYKKMLDKEKNSTKNKEIDKFFDSIWELYPNKRGKTAIKPTKRKELFKLGFDKLRFAIESYKKDPELEANGGFKNYLNGSTFFNNRYKEYLPIENQTNIEDVLKPTNTNIKRKDL